MSVMTTLWATGVEVAVLVGGTVPVTVSTGVAVGIVAFVQVTVSDSATEVTPKRTPSLAGPTPLVIGPSSKYGLPVKVTVVHKSVPVAPAGNV